MKNSQNGAMAFHLPHQLIAMRAHAGERQLFAQAINSIVDGFVPRQAYWHEATAQEASRRYNLNERVMDEMAQMLLACSVNPMTLVSKALTDVRDFRSAANLFFDNKALAVKIKVDVVADTIAVSRTSRQPITGLVPAEPTPMPSRRHSQADPRLCQEATACLLHNMCKQLRMPFEPSQPAKADQSALPCKSPNAFNSLAKRLGQTHTAEYALIELLQAQPTLTLGAAAAGLGCSPRALQRQLHPLGLSFPRLRLAVGVLASVRLLAQGEQLTQAAVAAGFYDYPHFARIFKRSTGMSPMAYQGILQHASKPALLNLI